MKIKKIISILLVATIISISAFGCSTSTPSDKDGTQTTTYTDDLGRTEVIPENIERVASSGPIADVMLYSACPDLMVGFATHFPDMAQGYIDENSMAKPVYGQYYGKNANMNIESLMSLDPQIIIDMGEKKDGMVESLDKLQEQTGIPVVFIEATFDNFDKTYTKIGEILNIEDEVKPLADYCNDTINMIHEDSSKIPDQDKIKVYAAEGSDGLNAISQGSINGKSILEVGASNVAYFDGSNSKSVNPTSKEQIMVWNPDVMFLQSDSAYTTVTTDPSWSTISAVKNNKVYMVPSAPYSYLGGPASTNQLIGALWLGNLLYPQVYDYNINDKIKEFYSLFYHCDVTDQQIDTILENAI